MFFGGTSFTTLPTEVFPTIVEEDARIIQGLKPIGVLVPPQNLKYELTR